MKLLFDENLSPNLPQIGNCTRAELLALIQRHEPDIFAFEISAETVLILS